MHVLDRDLGEIYIDLDRRNLDKDQVCNGCGRQVECGVNRSELCGSSRDYLPPRDNSNKSQWLKARKEWRAGKVAATIGIIKSRGLAILYEATARLVSAARQSKYKNNHFTIRISISDQRRPTTRPHTSSQLQPLHPFSC